MRSPNAPAQTTTHAPPQAMPPMSMQQTLPQAYYPAALPRGARMLQNIGGFFKTSFFLAVGIFGAEMIAPDPYKPSTLMGEFTGKVDVAEMRTKQAQVASMERDVSFARAQAASWQHAYTTLYDRANKVREAAYQIEVLLLQTKAQAVAGAQGGKALIATFSDIACFVGQLDPKTGAQKACGVGDKMRQDMASEHVTTALNGFGSLGDELLRGLPDPAGEAATLPVLMPPPAAFATQPVTYR